MQSTRAYIENFSSIIETYMESLQFRTKLFLYSLILTSILYYLIRPQLAEIYIILIGLSVVIVSFLCFFSEIFDIIEKGSSLKYWEIKHDNESDTEIQKFINFTYSYFYLLFFNFLISVNSIFLLYKLGGLSNDPPLLILASMTIVILIRFLAYYNNEVAKEIGKGFRYAMFPLGFSLFLWDFLVPLTKKYPSQFQYQFIIDNTAIIVVLGFTLIVVTSFEPLFEILNKFTINYNRGRESLSEVTYKKVITIIRRRTR